MKREVERKAALRTFSTGRLNVPLCSPSPASFLQDACSLFCLPHRVSFSPGADAEEKTPAGLQENSIKERRPCPEKIIPAIRCRELQLFPPLAKPQNVSAEKNAVSSLQVPEDDARDMAPWSRPAARKNAGPPFKKIPAELRRKKTAGKG